MFSNYIYDWIFPQTAALIEQVGVQSLSSPQPFFYFRPGPDRKPRDGTIVVNYAQGTDTRGYVCEVSVEPSGLFEGYAFDPNAAGYRSGSRLRRCSRGYAIQQLMPDARTTGVGRRRLKEGNTRAG